MPGALLATNTYTLCCWHVTACRAGGKQTSATGEGITQWCVGALALLICCLACCGSAQLGCRLLVVQQPVQPVAVAHEVNLIYSGLLAVRAGSGCLII